MTSADGRPAAVIFDVDGTLVDSERDGHRPAFNQAMAEAGLDFHWDEELYGRLLLTTGGRARLEAFLGPRLNLASDQLAQLAARIHRRKTEVFLDMVRRGLVPARPGAKRLVEELSLAAVPMAVATTGSRAWVEPLLEQAFGGGRFVAMATGDEAPIRKPDPSVYEIALEQLAAAGVAVADRAQVLAVEDSEPGLAAAVGAKVPCLVVVNDYTKDQDFQGAAAEVDGFGLVDHPARRISPPGPPVVVDLAYLSGLIRPGAR